MSTLPCHLQQCQGKECDRPTSARATSQSTHSTPSFQHREVEPSNLSDSPGPSYLFSQPGPSSLHGSTSTHIPEIIEVSDSDSELSLTEQLAEIFPQYNEKQLVIALTLCESDVKRVCQLFLDADIMAPRLLRLLKRRRMATTYRNITVDPECILQDALRVYKCPEFDLATPLMVEFENQLAIDMGAWSSATVLYNVSTGNGNFIRTKAV